MEFWLERKASSQKDEDKHCLVQLLGKHHLPWKFKSGQLSGQLSALLNINSFTQLSLEFSLFERWSFNCCAYWALNHWTTFSNNLSTERRKFIYDKQSFIGSLNSYFFLPDHRWISCSTRYFLHVQNVVYVFLATFVFSKKLHEVLINSFSWILYRFTHYPKFED